MSGGFSKEDKKYALGALPPTSWEFDEGMNKYNPPTHPLPQDTVYYSFIQTRDVDDNWVMGPRFTNKEERNELLEADRISPGIQRHPIIITTTHTQG